MNQTDCPEDCKEPHLHRGIFFGPPWWVVVLDDKLNHLLLGVRKIMADQDKLDADVAALSAATAAVHDGLEVLNQEIAALKAQAPAAALNFDGLDAAVAAVQGLVPAPAAPVTETPAAS